MNAFDLNTDIKQFGRRMKCKVYFSQVGEKENADSDRVTHFNFKLVWTPDVANPALDPFI